VRHNLQEAQPVAIREQKLLFDHVREGEKVLHLLETITPAAFMEQYASIALSLSLSRLTTMVVSPVLSSD
jgi:hypothetical protein